MMADKFLYERVARADSVHYSCRAWLAEESIGGDELRRIVEAGLAALEMEEKTIDEVLLDICSAQGINSVEIVEIANGVGMCIHKNWP